jgi:hypothetical protein
VTPSVPMKECSKSRFDAASSGDGAELPHGHYRDSVSVSAAFRTRSDRSGRCPGRPLRVAPSLASCRYVLLLATPLPGIPGCRSRFGVAPSACRRGSLLPELCPGTACVPSRVAARRSRFARIGRHLRDIFPAVGLASSGARGSRTGGAQARWPSPRPSWPRDPPGLHGHSTG